MGTYRTCPVLDASTFNSETAAGMELAEVNQLYCIFATVWNFPQKANSVQFFIILVTYSNSAVSETDIGSRRSWLVQYVVLGDNLFLEHPIFQVYTGHIVEDFLPVPNMPG